MPSTKTAIFLSLGFLAAITVSQNSTCAAGVHMIVARASTEAPGTGIIGNVAQRVQAQIPGSDIVAVDYPATLQNYVQSEQQGVAAMLKLVNAYATACPSSKMVLMGYSQGAQVSADVLCGTSEANFPPSQPLPAAITDKIAAVVLMGDPSHVPGQAFDQGTSQKNGVFPRQNNAGCAGVSSKIVSFCNSNDTFCDSGSDLNVHLSYIQTNGDAATNFILTKAKSP